MSDVNQMLRQGLYVCVCGAVLTIPKAWDGVHVWALQADAEGFGAAAGDRGLLVCRC